MKKANMSRGKRGASLVEYALLLVGILLLAVAAVKALGPKGGQAATKAGNDKLLEDGDYNNYKALKALDELGMLDVSERDLMVREFDPLLTPRYVLVDGRLTACYNNYGIYAVDETMFKIIKISSWEKLDK